MGKRKKVGAVFHRNRHGRDGLAAGVLGVGDRVADHGLEEDLEDTAGLLVDEAADALDTTTASQTADGGLGDALDVVPQGPCGGAWRRPFRVPFLLFHVQTLLLFVCVCVCVNVCVCLFVCCCCCAESGFVFFPTRNSGAYGG